MDPHDKSSLSSEQAYSVITPSTCTRDVSNSKVGRDIGFKRSPFEQISGYYLDRISDQFLWNPYH